MSKKPKFCNNCGQELDHNLEIKNCPKCGTDLKVDSVSKPSFAEQVPHKSPGTAALIALIGGIFGLMGS